MTVHKRVLRYFVFVSRSPSPPTGMHDAPRPEYCVSVSTEPNNTTFDWWLGAAVRPAQPSPTPPIWCRVYPPPHISDILRSNCLATTECFAVGASQNRHRSQDFCFTNLLFFTWNNNSFFTGSAYFENFIFFLFFWIQYFKFLFWSLKFASIMLPLPYSISCIYVLLSISLCANCKGGEKGRSPNAFFCI